MEIKSLNLYKVWETPQAIVITNAADRLQRNDAMALVEGGMEVCCEYLQRYTYYRRKGLNMREAHHKALSDANVLVPGQLDKPN